MRRRHPEATVIVMVRAPLAGRTKTRLARGVGAVSAARLYRAVAGGVIRRLACQRWRLVLTFAPDGAVASRWFGGSSAARHGQGRGDLGSRMARAMRDAGDGPVLVVGSDLPELGASDIAAALKALRTAPVVVGPSPDGGYWLIGFGRRKPFHGLFRNVRWSGPHALADTLASLPAGCGVARLHVQADLDEPADLAAFGGVNALGYRCRR